MKTMKKLAALLLAVLFLASAATFGASAENEPVQKPAIITAGAVNVRAQPGESADRIGGLTLGKEVFVLEMTIANGKIWYKIYYQDTVGYILSTYAFLVKDIGMVTVGALNVRLTPSTGGLRVGGLSMGDGVYILEEIENEEGTWYRISYGVTDAYVLGSAIGIMRLPTSDGEADYKKNVVVRAYGYNVPAGYKMVVDGKMFVSNGQTEFPGDVLLGQLTVSHTVPIRIYDANDNLKGEFSANIAVKNNFGAKLLAFLRFVFSGFRWGDQVVEIK